ncbi:MAG TPA: SpoIVB peptidase S55 domain-containing protein [Polyangia bacterium]|nr:SpoIVB peptidase S55 domain-containing protein [Polyangia bacterium]
MTLVVSGIVVGGALATNAATPAKTPTKTSSAAPRAIVSGGPPPPLLKLADVRPGMVGQALTVFQGTKPEPFKIRVVAVLKQFLPKEDVILIRAEDPRVEHSGIVAGMSGSPVYIDGKLMGAIAYAWSFAKDPLGGVTPIESMLAERSRPRRRSPEDVGVATAEPDEPRALPALAAATNDGEPHLVRASVPLAVSGFTARTIAELTDELRPTGLVPTQAGGGRRLDATTTSEPGHVEPGSAIGVELVRGDMSMVGTGTVTYVDGATVLAFGHPMFGIGEVYLPIVDAEIHAFLPSLAQSFKLSSPLHEIGTLVQDRQTCIIGALDAHTTMMPVDVRVTGPEGKTRTFHADVARNRRLTPMLASAVVANAVSQAEPDVTDVVATIAARLDVHGRGTLALDDQTFSTEGLSGRVVGGARGMRALSELMFNPFEPVAIDRLDVDIRFQLKRDAAEIIGVALPREEVRAGETVPVRVTLRPYAGGEYVETVPVKIPLEVAGQSVRIEVASGVTVRPDMAPAETLSGLIDNMKKYYTAANIVVSVQRPDEGAALRGRLLQDLPASAMDTLRPGTQSRRADAYRATERTVFASKRLVTGHQEVTVAVRDDALGAHK